MAIANRRQLIPTIDILDVDQPTDQPPFSHPLTPIDAIAEALPYPGKSQAVIDAAPADMQEGDWLEVALAAIDQAGFPLEGQRWLSTILRASHDRRQEKAEVAS